MATIVSIVDDNFFNGGVVWEMHREPGIAGLQGVTEVLKIVVNTVYSDVVFMRGAEVSSSARKRR